MKTASTFALLFGNSTTANLRNRPVDRSVVRDFEIEDFAGVWYEIARIDNNTEFGLSHVSSTFMVDADGDVNLRTEGFDCSKGVFQVRRSHVSIPDAGRMASMKVSGRPFSDREINVLEVDEDYNFALVGGRSANRLWILSRAPYIPDEDLGYLLARAMERGYDVSALVFPEHASVLSSQGAFACAI